MLGLLITAEGGTSCDGSEGWTGEGRGALPLGPGWAGCCRRLFCQGPLGSTKSWDVRAEACLPVWGTAAGACWGRDSAGACDTTMKEGISLPGRGLAARGCLCLDGFCRRSTSAGAVGHAAHQQGWCCSDLAQYQACRKHDGGVVGASCTGATP